MKITREINGQAVEFELTFEEMVTAYYERQKVWDREDIEMLFDDYREDEGQFLVDYGVEFSEANDNLDIIAGLFRQNMDEYEVDYASARENALNDWIEIRNAGQTRR